MALRNFIIAIISVIYVAACTPIDNRDYVANSQNSLTIADAQNKIKKGMSGEEVLSAFGSPNIISNNAQGNEVWVYDKISTEYVTAQSGNGVIGWSRGIFGASSQTQKTLTIIVKFDENRQVDDVKYHQSRF